MYKKAYYQETTMNLNQSQEGETIEQKMERIINNKEPITDGAPITYTERKDGVQPEFNPRTDRWEVAITAMDKVHRSAIAKREERQRAVEEMNEKVKQKDEKNEPKNGEKSDSGAE